MEFCQALCCDSRGQVCSRASGMYGIMGGEGLDKGGGLQGQKMTKLDVADQASLFWGHVSLAQL